MVAKVTKPIAYTLRPKSYRGDTTIQMLVRDSLNRSHIMFNMHRRRYGRLGLYYFNDRFSTEPFKTIAEAKEFALKVFRKQK